MKYRTLSNTDEALSAVGLGCMGMSFAYGTPDDEQSIQTLHRALELGVNFWDTADMYGQGHNEELLGKVLRENRDKVFLATKFGIRYEQELDRDDPSTFKTYFDGSPEYVKQACEASLQRLGIDTIDLYYSHRVDPEVPIEETVGAMAELVEEGKVRYLGLSEASPESLRRAAEVHPIAALQTEYSLFTREVEEEILPTCRKLDISFIPYSPLGRGMLTGTLKEVPTDDADYRTSVSPRFRKGNFEQNKKLVDKLEQVAADKGCTPAQLAIAWVLHQGEDIIPIPGTKRIKYLEENTAAADISFSDKELKKITQLSDNASIAGERYSEGGMKLVNN